MVFKQLNKESVGKIMNKNDLRYIKTEKIIKDTYLSLKKKYHSQIKVSELCKAAMINKSTFYSHYETIDYLHQELCNEIIKDMISDLLNVDTIKNDLESFVISIIKNIQTNIKIINLMFGDDKIKLVDCVEDCLLCYFSKHEEFKEKEKEIIFAIGGAANLLMTSQNKEIISAAIKLIHKTIN